MIGQSKTLSIQHGLYANKFEEDFSKKKNLYKLYKILNWQNQNLLTYIDFFKEKFVFYNEDRFNKLKNFESIELILHDSSSLIELAQSFNINKETLSDIFYEWEVKFIPTNSSIGLKEFFRIYNKYLFIKKGFPYKEAKKIADTIDLFIYNWYSNEISQVSDNTYWYDDNQLLSIYMELVLPKKYVTFFGYNLDYSKNALLELKKRLLPSLTINYIDISWR